MYREERRVMKRTTPRFVSPVEEKTVSWKFFNYTRVCIYMAFPNTATNPFTGILRLDGAVCHRIVSRIVFYYVRAYTTKYAWKNIFKGQSWREFFHRETRRVQFRSLWKFDFFFSDSIEKKTRYIMLFNERETYTANILLLRWKR